jgi:dCMP deaminase
MATQQNLDNTYMAMAKELAKLSYANRAKVGCIIVKDTHIISEGYNGTPEGFSNVCEHPITWKTLPEVLHAESNAITKLARSTSSSEGATLYVTMAPCYECSKLIIQSGIKRVVYHENYHSDGIALLTKVGIIVESIC